ncbi:MAG: hypothetical protein AAFR55_04015 [Pseudomonadota bacterium]
MAKTSGGVLTLVLATTVGASGMVAIPIDAEAAIQCRGSSQLSGGRYIVTPYCEDQVLARVARSYGMNVSDRAVRQSVSTKQRVCDLVGNDTRVRDVCAPYRRGPRNRIFP